MTLKESEVTLKDSGEGKSSQWAEFRQCTWSTTLYGQRSEYIWTHGQWQIARLNGQGSRTRAISVLVYIFLKFSVLYVAFTS